MDIFNIFPKENVKIIGYPSTLQKLADFEMTLLWLSEIVPLKRLPSQLPGRSVVVPLWI